MNLRNDFEEEHKVESTIPLVEEMLYLELEEELARFKSIRLREKVLRDVCAKYALEEYEIFELIDWFV